MVGWKLGRCCACNEAGPAVQNLLRIDLRSPEPGPGCWGCERCGLPEAGAVAVLCDSCVDAGRAPRYFCLGPPAENRRAPVELLNRDEPFQHDPVLHPEEAPGN